MSDLAVAARHRAASNGEPTSVDDLDRAIVSLAARINAATRIAGSSAAPMVRFPGYFAPCPV